MKPKKIDIEKAARKISAVVTHPEFVKMLAEISATPAEDRYRALRRVANPRALAKRGIPVPKDVKVTTRYFFEDMKISGEMVLPAKAAAGRTVPKVQGAGCVCIGTPVGCFGSGW